MILLFMVLITDHCFAYQNNSDLSQELLIVMKAYHVPVVGYAVIKNYKIVSSQTLSIDSKLMVSQNSIFQAASISKTISAYGALKQAHSIFIRVVLIKS